jgi:acyl-CoA synthetase (AMP-forming)/AMP-acid ligase II
VEHDELPEHFNAASFFVDRHRLDDGAARTAFRSAGRSVTYGDVAAASDRCGHALAALGVEIENRVLLVLDDTPAFAAVFWGVVKLGAVAVPVNTLMTPEQYEFVLNDSRAKIAVVEAAVAAHLLAVRHRCPWLRHIVVAGRALAGTLEPDV